MYHRQKRSSEEDVAAGTIGKKVSPLPRRDARQIYNPPSGKYSASIGNFSYGEFGELKTRKKGRFPASCIIWKYITRLALK